MIESTDPPAASALIEFIKVLPAICVAAFAGIPSIIAAVLSWVTRKESRATGAAVADVAGKADAIGEKMNGLNAERTRTVAEASEQRRVTDLIVARLEAEKRTAAEEAIAIARMNKDAETIADLKRRLEDALKTKPEP